MSDFHKTVRTVTAASNARQFIRRNDLHERAQRMRNAENWRRRKEREARERARYLEKARKEEYQRRKVHYEQMLDRLRLSFAKVDSMDLIRGAVKYYNDKCDYFKLISNTVYLQGKRNSSQLAELESTAENMDEYFDECFRFPLSVIHENALTLGELFISNSKQELLRSMETEAPPVPHLDKPEKLSLDSISENPSIIVYGFSVISLIVFLILKSPQLIPISVILWALGAWTSKKWKVRTQSDIDVKFSEDTEKYRNAYMEEARKYCEQVKIFAGSMLDKDRNRLSELDQIRLWKSSIDANSELHMVLMKVIIPIDISYREKENRISNDDAQEHNDSMSKYHDVPLYRVIFDGCDDDNPLFNERSIIDKCMKQFHEINGSGFFAQDFSFIPQYSQDSASLIRHPEETKHSDYKEITQDIEEFQIGLDDISEGATVEDDSVSVHDVTDTVRISAQREAVRTRAIKRILPIFESFPWDQTIGNEHFCKNLLSVFDRTASFIK